MYKRNELIDNKLNSLFEEYTKIRENFVDFKEFLDSYVNQPLTHKTLDEIQYRLDDFIELNNLNIKLCVTQYDNSILIFGHSVTDQIIWETIQI